MSTNKLVKDHENQMLDGVLAGIANYFDTDPALIRIIYYAFTLWVGFFPGLILYFVLCICIPDEYK